jgi:hypothetical protein
MKVIELIKLLEEARVESGDDLIVLVPRNDLARPGWEPASGVSVCTRYFFHEDDGGSYPDKSVTLL